jgi:hypothetical protein
MNKFGRVTTACYRPSPIYMKKLAGLAAEAGSYAGQRHGRNQQR